MTVAEALAHPWISQEWSAPTTQLSSVVLSRLQSFTRTTRLERLLLNVAAHQLTSKEIDRLGAMFRALDHDNDGCGRCPGSTVLVTGCASWQKRGVGALFSMDHAGCSPGQGGHCQKHSLEEGMKKMPLCTSSVILCTRRGSCTFHVCREFNCCETRQSACSMPELFQSSVYCWCAGA
jgi:hypothetical protein